MKDIYYLPCENKMVDASSQRKFLNRYFTNKSMGTILYVRERNRSTVRPIHNSAERRQSYPDHPQYEAGCQFLHRKAWSPWI